jgi:hypothetical protein
MMLPPTWRGLLAIGTEGFMARRVGTRSMNGLAGVLLVAVFVLAGCASSTTSTVTDYIDCGDPPTVQPPLGQACLKYTDCQPGHGALAHGYKCRPVTPAQENTGPTPHGSGPKLAYLGHLVRGDAYGEPKPLYVGDSDIYSLRGAHQDNVSRITLLFHYGIDTTYGPFLLDDGRDALAATVTFDAPGGWPWLLAVDFTDGSRELRTGDEYVGLRVDSSFHISGGAPRETVGPCDSTLGQPVAAPFATTLDLDSTGFASSATWLQLTVMRGDADVAICDKATVLAETDTTMILNTTEYLPEAARITSRALDQDVTLRIEWHFGPVPEDAVKLAKPAPS